MRRPRYPLEPLVELREQKVEEAAVGLAGAVHRRERAEQERKAAESARAAHDAASLRVRQGEGEALSRGELRAGDLASADAWEARVTAERATMSTAVDRARATEDNARATEHAARGEVAARQADAKAVARGRARWADEQRKQSEAKEEEAASETWRP